MKTFIIYICSAFIMGFACVAYAGNWVGAGLTLSVAPPTPAAVPTPPPSSATTADPNANPVAKAELAWLQSLESAGSTQHIVQSNQEVVRQCSDVNGNDNCSGEDAENYASDGNQYTGAIAVDYCNGYWGDGTTPMCIFGANSDTNVQAKAWWAAGSMIQMSMHFPNPFDNWQVASAGSAKGVICPAYSGSVNKGLSDDCYYPSSLGSLDAAVQNMITPGTALNAQWNSELSNFAGGLQDLQNSGVVVILRLFHELDGNWFWWCELSSGTQAALWQYTENYFENQGIHNVLYEYCVIGGVTGYPGSQYIDIVSWDQYGELPGGGYLPPVYSALLNYGKPIAIAENNCSASGGACDTSSNPYGYDAQDADARSLMPNLVWINYWWGPNAGVANNQGAGTGADPYWLGYMQDSYNIMRPSVPNLGR